MIEVNIWWIRRDLRLSDNCALQAALARGGSIVPIFILDPPLLASDYAGEKRVAFLMGGIRELDGALRQRDSYLVVRQGRSPVKLARLRQKVGASGRPCTSSAVITRHRSSITP